MFGFFLNLTPERLAEWQRQNELQVAAYKAAKADPEWPFADNCRCQSCEGRRFVLIDRARRSLAEPHERAAWLPCAQPVGPFIGVDPPSAEG